jgi:hypothetical protein
MPPNITPGRCKLRPSHQSRDDPRARTNRCDLPRQSNFQGRPLIKSGGFCSRRESFPPVRKTQKFLAAAQRRRLCDGICDRLPTAAEPDWTDYEVGGGGSFERWREEAVKSGHFRCSAVCCVLVQSAAPPRERPSEQDTGDRPHSASNGIPLRSLSRATRVPSKPSSSGRSKMLAAHRRREAQEGAVLRSHASREQHQALNDHSS